LLKHQTSSTSTTSTTSTTTYVPPRRSKRKAPGSKESYSENPPTEEVFFYDEYDGENDDEEVWLREKREALDEQRDYQYEGHAKAFREDGKWMIGARGMWPYGEGEKSTRAWVEHQFMEEFTVLEFDEVEFEEEHIRLLTERDGQWLDDTKNLTLWLSQSCYETRKCLISDIGRCENTILDILPLGFTHEKPKTMVPRSRENLDLKEEYMVPVGGEVNIKCSEPNQKISKDEWDNNPKDQLLTVKCLPNFKFDIPASNFPRCRGYCPAPGRLWNVSTMENDVLPLQRIYTLDPSLPFREATHPDVGYRQLEPNDYTGLTLNRNKTNPEDEFWEGDKIYFICINSTLGVEEGDSNEVTFRCRYDGVYAVPENNTWPECDIKTTTAKPPIVYGVQMSLEETDEELDSFMKMKDYLFMQTQGDVEGLFWKVTLPSGLILLLCIILCLLGTRHNSILCQVCNRDYELKQMQNYGHKDYIYEG